jgi:hypothetical protein
MQRRDAGICLVNCYVRSHSSAPVLQWSGCGPAQLWSRTRVFAAEGGYCELQAYRHLLRRLA